MQCVTKDCNGTGFYPKQNKCKKCIKHLRRQRYITDRKYYLNNRYNAMKQRAEGRAKKQSNASGLPCLTRQEFLSWFEETREMFYELWSAYEESGFDMLLAPSVDRKDSSKGYEIGNLQWLTYLDNCIKQDRYVDV